MPPKKTKKRRYVHCRCTVFGCCDGPGGSTWVTYDTARGHARRQKIEDVERAAAALRRPARALAPAPGPTTATTVASPPPTQALSAVSPAPSTSTAIGTKEDSNVGK